MEPAYIQTRAVLLLLLAPVWATAVRPGIRRLGDTVIVVQDTAQPVVLQAMMNATVSDLEFQVPDFTLVPAAWTYITEAAPFMLMRNFVISSSAQPPTVLDFQYLARRVVLGDGATAVNFTFKGVTLANIRKANNFGIDFFTNSQGSTVMFDNVVVLETACSAAPADALASAVSQPALAGHLATVPSCCLTPAFSCQMGAAALRTACTSTAMHSKHQHRKAATHSCSGTQRGCACHMLTQNVCGQITMILSGAGSSRLCGYSRGCSLHRSRHSSCPRAP